MMDLTRMRKGPLPGGRQGASGAGAGRDSMRTASRRARGAARPPSSPSHPSSPPAGLVSAGSSRAQQSAPATGGARRMRWTTQMNSNALRAYFRAKGGEIGGFAYRARMRRLFAELDPSISVTEQNLADQVRYILRSNTFDVTELERLRREAVPSSDENATAENAAPQLAEQPTNVDAAVNTPVLGKDASTFCRAGAICNRHRAKPGRPRSVYLAELERLWCEAVPLSDENATAENVVPQVAEQPTHVDAAVNTPVVADSNDDGTFAQELEIEQMRNTLEEAIVETRSTPLENRPRLPRIALSKRNRAVDSDGNPMLVAYMEASRDLCKTDSILFGAVLAVCCITGAKVSSAGRATV
ncbi:unnamed protein product [Parnassius apollo]|uniref:(apollo) hypothetical protein n=1 Tax=Parnassius apollo TaxID=110799 RepID=A0A8S3Y1Y5_PARAO|nr:unnamed protein product [Parnassius apollo]